ncbi:MAG: PAS domain-containing protein, partial [Rhodoferax sp.]
IHWMLRPLVPCFAQAPYAQMPSAHFQRGTEGMFMTDASGAILAVNAAFTRITGYCPDDVIGKSPRLLQSGLQDATFYKDFWAELQSAGAWQGQIFNRRKSGHIFPAWMRITSERNGKGQILSYHAAIFDLSGATPERMKNRSQLQPPNVYRTEPLVTSDE